MINAIGLIMSECINEEDGINHDCWADGHHVAAIVLYPVETVPSVEGENIRVCTYVFSGKLLPKLEQVGVFE